MAKLSEKLTRDFNELLILFIPIYYPLTLLSTILTDLSWSEILEFNKMFRLFEKNKTITPAEVLEVKIIENLLSYLNGEITDQHLAGFLKKEVNGESSKLSVKVTELLPEFTHLLHLLETNAEEGTILETIEKILDNFVEKNKNIS